MPLLMRGKCQPSIKQWKRSSNADSRNDCGKESKYLKSKGLRCSLSGMLPIIMSPHSELNSLLSIVVLPDSKYDLSAACISAGSWKMMV